jgi:hypothetical protein
MMSVHNTPHKCIYTLAVGAIDFLVSFELPLGFHESPLEPFELHLSSLGAVFGFIWDDLRRPWAVCWLALGELGHTCGHFLENAQN